MRNPLRYTECRSRRSCWGGYKPWDQPPSVYQIFPHPICLEVSHKFKGYVLKLFFTSIPKPFWWLFFSVLTAVTVLQSLSTPAAPSCNHNSHKLPSAVLLNMTDPSVIAALQPALVSVLGKMVLMWVRFMFVRAVVSEPASAAFPFSKTQKIYLSNTSWVPPFLSFLIAIPWKLTGFGFSSCPQCGFSLSLRKVVISFCSLCGVALPAAQLDVQTAVKWSLQDSWSTSAVLWHRRGRILVHSSLQLSACRAACRQVARNTNSLMGAYRNTNTVGKIVWIMNETLLTELDCNVGTGCEAFLGKGVHLERVLNCTTISGLSDGRVCFSWLTKGSASLHT